MVALPLFGRSRDSLLSFLPRIRAWMSAAERASLELVVALLELVVALLELVVALLALVVALLELVVVLPLFGRSRDIDSLLSFRARIRAWMSAAERVSSPVWSGRPPCSTPYSVTHSSAAKPATCTSPSKKRGVVKASCQTKNAATPTFKNAATQRSIVAKLIPEVRGGDLAGTLLLWARACLPRIPAWSVIADEISAALGAMVGALWPRGSWADEPSAGAFALCAAAAATAGLDAVFASSSLSLLSCRSCSSGVADPQKNAAIFARCASSGLGAGLRLAKGDGLRLAEGDPLPTGRAVRRPSKFFLVLRRAICPRQFACTVVAAFDVFIRRARALLEKDMRRSFRLSARLARKDRTLWIGLGDRSPASEASLPLCRGNDTMPRAPRALPCGSLQVCWSLASFDAREGLTQPAAAVKRVPGFRASRAPYKLNRVLTHMNPAGHGVMWRQGNELAQRHQACAATRGRTEVDPRDAEVRLHGDEQRELGHDETGALRAGVPTRRVPQEAVGVVVAPLARGPQCAARLVESERAWLGLGLGLGMGLGLGLG